MRYPPESEIHTMLVDRLAMVAPGFTLMHFTAHTNHEGVHLTACMREGLNRLSIEAKAWSEFLTIKRFIYIGTAPCAHTRPGYDRRVQMLMRVHPDAHIQHVDNEEDGDDAVFGYIAYDDKFQPLAWAPLPINDEGMALPNAPAHITHTIPVGVRNEMDFICNLAIEQYE